MNKYRLEIIPTDEKTRSNEPLYHLRVYDTADDKIIMSYYDTLELIFDEVKSWVNRKPKQI